MTKEQITALDCKKHIKIYKLKQLGLSDKDIATELSTGVGHIYNVLKEYERKPEKKQKADLIGDYVITAGGAIEGE